MAGGGIVKQSVQATRFAVLELHGAIAEGQRKRPSEHAAEEAGYGREKDRGDGRAALLAEAGLQPLRVGLCDPSEEAEAEEHDEADDAAKDAHESG